MKKIKFTVFGLIGIAVLTTGLISCDNDVVSSNEGTTESTLKAKFGDMAYQDFYLGQVESDGWGDAKFRFDFSFMQGGCLDIEGNCAPYDIIIIIEPKKNLYSNLVNNPHQFLSIFENNQNLLEEDIHPTLVSGVIDGYFRLEIVVNSDTNTNYFRFYREHDDELVATYPIIIAD